MNSFRTTNKRKRPNTEGWEAAGTLWGGEATEHHCLHFLPLPLGGSSIPVLWPTCNITIASSQVYYTEPFISEQREQAGTGHHHMHLASLLGAAPVWQTSARGTISTCPAPTGFPKLPGTKAYTEFTSTQNYFLQNKQDRDCIEKAGETWELSRDCENSLGLEVSVSAIVHCPPLPPQSRQGLYPGTLTYLQGCNNVFSDTLPEPTVP